MPMDEISHHQLAFLFFDPGFSGCWFFFPLYSRAKKMKQYRCEGITSKGKRCKVRSKFHFCHHHFQKQEALTCSICLDMDDTRTQTRLRCGHVFHSSCVASWLQVNASCPLCRCNILVVPETCCETADDTDSLFEMELDVLPPPRRMIPRRRRYVREAARLARQFML
jgi:hypothetical protein